MIIRSPDRMPVQSLGRQAPAGRASVSGVTDLAKSIVSTGAAIQGEVTNRHKQQADIFMRKVENEFKSARGGKDFHDVNSLPESVVTPGMEVKGMVPSSEVYPAMYKLAMEEALESASIIIEDESARADWMEGAVSSVQSQHALAQVSANKAMDKQILNAQVLDYQEAIKSEDYASAINIAENMSSSAEQKDKFILAAKQDGEVNTYKSLTVTENVPFMKDAIEFLSQDQDDYRKAGGTLDAGDRLAQKKGMMTEINRINRVDKAGVSANKKLIKRNIKVMISNLLKGQSSDPSGVVELNRMAEEAGVSPGILQDLSMANVFSIVNEEQIKLPANERLELIDSENIYANLNDIDSEQLKGRLTESHNSQRQKELNDPMQAAADAGLIDLSPINSRDPAEFAAQIKVRFSQMGLIESNYETSAGKLLTNAEAKNMSGVFNSLTASDQVAFLGAVSAEMGSEAIGLYDQLVTDGYSTSAAVAGIVSSQGQNDQAQAILIGNEYRRNNKDEVKLLATQLKPAILEKFGTSFWNSGGMQKATKDAAFDAYVYYALSTGAGLQEIDDDLVDRAITASTGGIVSYGDQSLQAPEYGLSQEVFENWIENVNPEYIKELGSIEGMGAKNFTKTLADGDFKLDPIGQGEWIVTRNNGTPLLNSRDGGAFVLKYDSDAVFMTKKLNRLERRNR